MISKRIILLCFLMVTFANAVQVMFDSFLSCNNSGMFECNVRVHKINRTTAALLGSFVHRVDIGENFEALIELYHSPLGNNQFNRYPMKIGPTNMCGFIRNYWEDYREYVVSYIPNVAKPGECPLSARTLLVNDWILDPRMFPPYVPTGLWKMVWKASDRVSGEFFESKFIFKAYQNGYF